MIEGSKLPEEDREEYVRGITEAMEVARTYKTEGGSCSESEGDQFPLVTFLGTGSSVPSKYRNVTGILVETQPDSFIIMDCGEGTLGQLVRLHGVEVRRAFAEIGFCTLQKVCNFNNSAQYFRERRGSWWD